MTQSEFIDLLGSIYAHTPWVAATAFEQIPFESHEDLIFTFKAIVEDANEETKLSLIRAHPDLGNKLIHTSEITHDSTQEQLDHLNAAYLDKFGFPFIICVKHHTYAQVLAAFTSRFENSHEKEILQALHQIHLIAQLKIVEKISLAESSA